ncbi:uncharacterized protein LOC121659357 [Corvus kubaryi]|uniref:uncharacterized protein LOC121659357 n=1 Tax=Corvus kubaryi TaxID=68294 RepID=UPI001C04B649|nr:uncharacterized protein LOC121659357 [Corvus kubaryi]
MTGEFLSVSAQLDKCQASLAIKAHPHEWHGIAGCSQTAPNKPLPSQKMDHAFETRYSTVFSISNNMVQQCLGNLMTHSSDCLRICCRAVAQTAAGVWKKKPRAFSALHGAKVSGLVSVTAARVGNVMLVPQTQGPCYQHRHGTAETKDRSYTMGRLDQKQVVIDCPEKPDLGFVAPPEAGRQQMRGSSRWGTCVFGQSLQGHPQPMAGTPTYFMVLFIHLNLMETMDLWCCTALFKALRPK